MTKNITSSSIKFKENIVKLNEVTNNEIRILNQFNSRIRKIIDIIKKQEFKLEDPLTNDSAKNSFRKKYLPRESRDFSLFLKKQNKISEIKKYYFSIQNYLPNEKINEINYYLELSKNVDIDKLEYLMAKLIEISCKRFYFRKGNANNFEFFVEQLIKENKTDEDNLLETLNHIINYLTDMTYILNNLIQNLNIIFQAEQIIINYIISINSYEFNFERIFQKFNLHILNGASIIIDTSILIKLETNKIKSKKKTFNLIFPQNQTILVPKCITKEYNLYIENSRDFDFKLSNSILKYISNHPNSENIELKEVEEKNKQFILDCWKNTSKGRYVNDKDCEQFLKSADLKILNYILTNNKTIIILTQDQDFSAIIKEYKERKNKNELPKELEEFNFNNVEIIFFLRDEDIASYHGNNFYY